MTYVCHEWAVGLPEKSTYTEWTQTRTELEPVPQPAPLAASKATFSG